MLLDIFNNYYELFDIIMNESTFINMFSLNLVCKKFNNKINIIIINSIINKLINNILNVYNIYDKTDIIDEIKYIEQSFLLTLIYKYHKDFITIYNLSNNGIEYNTNGSYDKLDNIYYIDYVNILCPNMDSKLIAHIIEWDFLELDLKDFAADVAIFFGSKNIVINNN